MISERLRHFQTPRLDSASRGSALNLHYSYIGAAGVPFPHLSLWTFEEPLRLFELSSRRPPSDSSALEGETTLLLDPVPPKSMGLLVTRGIRQTLSRPVA